jgi:hypothetical protein
MFDFPTILGCFALLLLLGAIVTSAKLFYGAAAQRLDGSLESNPAAELSSIMLLASLVLSLVAAGFAVTWHFLPQAN